MLLSIIIPSYNQGELLKQALLSIEQQTFKDYEIVIIDGCSTDSTSIIVNQFKHLPIIFSSKRDKGIYDAMNIGIKVSRGEYLYFLGCDDSFYSKDVLMSVFSSKNIKNKDVIYGNVKLSETGYVYDGQFSIFKLILSNICHQAIFVSKRVFDKIGVFNLRYKTYADWEFNMRWFGAKNINKVYLPIIIANYNINGFSSSANDDNFFADKDFLEQSYFPKFFIHLDRNKYRPGYWRVIRFLSKRNRPFIEKVIYYIG